MNIAIIEDEKEYAALLIDYLHRYEKEFGTEFQTTHFTNAVSFLENYKGNYDLILMDIQMPYINGMDAAKRLREIDKNVLLIFITNLTQYAISGYEVEAFDYVLKPIGYYDFALKISRAVPRVSTQTKSELLIHSTEGLIKINPLDIRYLESEKHHVIYHLGDKICRQYAGISAIEKELKPYSFFRCNNCYLVNLRFVEAVKGYSVTVDGTELQISQPRKKPFIQALIAYTEGKTHAL